MSGMETIRENVIIDAWAKAFSRSPGQQNDPHESDAELVELPGDPGRLLAVTIDTVYEEIAEGIYRNPHTMGWVTAVASLSDLAAVGADALGLLLSVSVQADKGGMAAGIAAGIEEACLTHNVFVLGGDTNEAPGVSLTSCAVGTVPKGEALSRRGVAPGDAVFLSGPAGSGNALGLARLGGHPDDAFPEESYRPAAELAAGKFLRGYASACMDTSDGVFATLDQLMRLNAVGFVVDCDWWRMLAPEVVAFCAATETPHWLMAAGPHGEFRLLYTVPAEKVSGFLDAAQAEGMMPVSLGTAQPAPSISLALTSGRTVDIDVAFLRNLMYEVGGDMERYVREFIEAGEKWGLD